MNPKYYWPVERKMWIERLRRSNNEFDSGWIEFKEKYIAEKEKEKT